MPRDYRPPTGAELLRLLERWSMTQGDAADVLAVDGRTVRRWCQRDAAATSSRRMSFAALAWLTFRAVGVTITPENWRKEIPK